VGRERDAVSNKITAREADWLCCVLETFTNAQDRKADERIRQSAWEKLRKIRDSKRGQAVALDEPGCPGPDCLMCNGAACNLCGAGCWNNAAPHCDHDGDERHMEPVHAK
jgi:hypothetical protein